MAFFDQDDDIYVSSTTISLIEADSITTADTVLYAILSDASISLNLLNQTLNGLATKIPAYQSYAENTYALGLPDMAVGASPVLNETELATLIADELNLPYGIQVNSSIIAPLTIGYIVYPFLVATRGYQSDNSIEYLPDGYTLSDTDSNGNSQATKVTLSGLELEDNGTTITITYTAQETYYVEPSLTEYDAGGIGTYADGNSYTITETYEMAAAYDIGSTYCVVSYYKYDAVAALQPELHWWFYDIATGVHPEITESAEQENEQNLLPVVPLRYNNYSVRDETSEYYDADVYDTGKTLLNKISIDMDSILDSLDTSEDIADIDFAYIMFGVNLQTESMPCIAYLTEFFDYIAENAEVSIFDTISAMLNGTQSLTNIVFFTEDGAIVPGTVVTETETIQTGRDEWTDVTVTISQNTTPNGFTLSEFGLHMYITYSSISSYTIIGSIGDIGTATVTKTLPAESAYTGTAWDDLDESTYTFKYQTSATSYKEVRVTGLNHYNRVYHEHTVRTTGSQVISDIANNNFIVPINTAIMQRLSVQDKDTIYGESCQLILNAYVVVSYEWYETSFFTWIVLMIMGYFIITSGQVWIAGLQGAFVAGGYYAVFMYIMQQVLIHLVITSLVKEVAAYIGPEIIAVLAVVISILGWYFGGTGWNMDLGFTTLPVASTLLSISYALFDAVQYVITQAIEDIAAQYDKFLDYMGDKYEAIELANEILHPETLLPFSLLDLQTRLTINPIRDPDTLYDITVHALPDLSYAALVMPSMYVEFATTPPDVSRDLWSNTSGGFWNI